MSGPPLRLDLRASPSLTLLTAAVHLAAAIILWELLAPPGAYAAALVVLLGAFAIWQRTLFRSPASPAFLELMRDGGLRLEFRNGSSVVGQVSARRYVSRWLVVLDLIGAHRIRRTVLVARDMLPAGEFRLLRLWALWKALPPRREPGGARGGPHPARAA